MAAVASGLLEFWIFQGVISGGYTRLFWSALNAGGENGGVPHALPVGNRAVGTRQGPPFAADSAGGRPAIAGISINTSKSESAGGGKRLSDGPNQQVAPLAASFSSSWLSAPPHCLNTGTGVSYFSGRNLAPDFGKFSHQQKKVTKQLHGLIPIATTTTNSLSKHDGNLYQPVAKLVHVLGEGDADGALWFRLKPMKNRGKFHLLETLSNRFRPSRVQTRKFNMRKLALTTLLAGLTILAGPLLLAQQTSSPTVPVEAQLLDQSKPIEHELKANETHAYKINLEAGVFLNAAVNQRGIDVVVRVFAPDGSKLADIDSPNGTQGDEPIALAARTTGTYRLEVSPVDPAAQPGRYEIRINEILSADDYARRLTENKRKQQGVITWLKNNATLIKTVEAGNGFEDLQPLKRVLQNVSFIGLGEETHGTREFFQFKHRMLEFLVKEMGFRVFAMEASYSACQIINDYVMGRSDDGAAALDSQGFWTWNTQEVRAMLDWLRAYNAGVRPENKVKFVGFDIQFNDTAKSSLLEYLKRAAPERVSETETLFKADEKELGKSVVLQDDKARDSLAKLKKLKDQYNDLFVFLEISGTRLAPKSSQTEYEQMREYARVMLQYISSYGNPNPGNGLRDLYMADNFRRIVTREPAGTRFVLWAHNGHISTQGSEDAASFGSHLRRFFDKDYYALGFSFNQGRFQSREAEPKDPPKRMLRSFEAEPAPADSIDWYLAQTGLKSFIVDFRSAKHNAELGEWLATPHPMRSIGSMYAPGFALQLFGATTIAKEFDGLFFTDTTTRARPNPSVKDVVPGI